MARTDAISTHDFSSTPADPMRDVWMVGTMHYVIKALGEIPVAIVTDRTTGGALIGATLVRAYDGGTAGHQLTLMHGRQLTTYRMSGLGSTIIPMVTSSARWGAINAFRDAQAVAIDRAREMNTEVRGWGTWGARPIADSWFVSYTPSTGDPAHAHEWGRIGFWQIPISVTG